MKYRNKSAHDKDEQLPACAKSALRVIRRTETVKSIIPAEYVTGSHYSWLRHHECDLEAAGRQAYRVSRNSVPSEIPSHNSTQAEHKAGPFVVTFFPVTLRKPFMKAVGSSPRTQHPATSLIPEPDESSFANNIYFITSFPSATGSSEWFLCFSFHNQNTVTATHATCLCYTFQFIEPCHRP